MIPTFCSPADKFVSHLGPNADGELCDHYAPCISFPTLAELIGWFEDMEQLAQRGAFGTEDPGANGSIYSGADAVARIREEIARIKEEAAND
jgi:hypothetical protein